MPNKKTTQLPSAATLNGSEVFAIAQNGVTKKLLISDLVQQNFDYIILRSQGDDGHQWKFTVDDTGMLSQPGEDLGV